MAFVGGFSVLCSLSPVSLQFLCSMIIYVRSDTIIGVCALLIDLWYEFVLFFKLVNFLTNEMQIHKHKPVNN